MNTKARIRVSQVFAVLVLAFTAVSGSAWEEHHEGVSSALFLGGCVLVGIASMGRLWCSLYIAGRKTKELIVTGPYSLCRNPLYVSSFLGSLGVGLSSETFSIPAFVTFAFALVYPSIVRREEEKLARVHGSDYAAYVRRTPRFVPELRLLEEPALHEVDPRRFRADLLRALWFVWAVGSIETFEAFRELGIFPTLFRIF